MAGVLPLLSGPQLLAKHVLYKKQRSVRASVFLSGAENYNFCSRNNLAPKKRAKLEHEDIRSVACKHWSFSVTSAAASWRQMNWAREKSTKQKGERKSDKTPSVGKSVKLTGHVLLKLKLLRILNYKERQVPEAFYNIFLYFRHVSTNHF